ncbi:hypothetical protein CEUSTIGMA_g6842.t1 [Chlamydomonas eustigma]|uniref:Uncharacterized protein n=1 Tax=Chlamydomonas eustigma TaxID=1157962 RepID=A0A250X8I7_9CHLO|nr:hypothetical protein CEUSTIGMA_g6842.t1 [Chlamydomonas eustigma]|eukprot:GAX79401.1 hypothetical protein CEUSTIGMA_g6842.t1 [Chlamydomonas eustigma]
MPLGGKLLLKGGEPLLEKKTKKKKRKLDEPEGQEEKEVLDPTKPKPVSAEGISVTGKKYEEEFEFEKQRIKHGQVKNTPWGSSYRAAPEILHGYTKKVTGKTAEERLDMRAATKSDKFAK